MIEGFWSSAPTCCSLQKIAETDPAARLTPGSGQASSGRQYTERTQRNRPCLGPSTIEETNPIGHCTTTASNICRSHKPGAKWKERNSQSFCWRARLLFQPRIPGGTDPGHPGNFFAPETRCSSRSFARRLVVRWSASRL
jgi:hypothetical protein